MESTVIEAVTVTALSDSLSYAVLLSNTTQFQPSQMLWKSCEHIKGRYWGTAATLTVFLITLYVQSFACFGSPLQAQYN